MKLNQVLQNIWFLGKLELSPCGCLPPHTNQVAVYTHVWPGSYNTCGDWYRALSHGATTWITWSSISTHHGAGGGVQWFKCGCRCEEALKSDAWILHAHVQPVSTEELWNQPSVWQYLLKLAFGLRLLIHLLSLSDFGLWPVTTNIQSVYSWVLLDTSRLWRNSLQASISYCIHKSSTAVRSVTMTFDHQHWNCLSSCHIWRNSLSLSEILYYLNSAKVSFIPDEGFIFLLVLLAHIIRMRRVLIEKGDATLHACLINKKQWSLPLWH